MNSKKRMFPVPRYGMGSNTSISWRDVQNDINHNVILPPYVCLLIDEDDRVFRLEPDRLIKGKYFLEVDINTLNYLEFRPRAIL
jgi:hypothetical protein